MEYGFFNMDCMEGMKDLPDKSIALAVVDPPYGDPQGGGGTGSARGSTVTRHGQGANCRNPDGSWRVANWRNMGGEVLKKIIAWDVAPGKEYFQELFRVSRNQIIWGGELLRTAADALFPRLGEVDHKRELFHGNGGVCVDVL